MASSLDRFSEGELLPSYAGAGQLLHEALTIQYTAESENYKACVDAQQAEAKLKDRQKNGDGSELVEEATKNYEKYEAARKEAAEAVTRAKKTVEKAMRIHRLAFTDSDQMPRKRYRYDGF